MWVQPLGSRCPLSSCPLTTSALLAHYHTSPSRSPHLPVSCAFPSSLLIRGLVPANISLFCPIGSRRGGHSRVCCNLLGGLVSAGAQSTWEKVPPSVVHVQPHYAQQHTVQVMQQTTFPSALCIAELGECRAVRALLHGCKLQQPTSSCEQGLVRSPLCRHVVSPPIPPWNSSCKANTGLSAVRGLQIFVVFFSISRAGTAPGSICSLPPVVSC